MDSGANAGTGQLYYETPVLNIMGRELSGFADLQRTLTYLGYNSGNALIRLTYKTTDQSLHSAMEEISRLFKEVEKEDAEEAAPAAAAAAGPSKTDDPSPAPQSTEATSSEPAPQAASSQPQEAQAQEQPSQPEAGAGSNAVSSDPYSPVNVYLAPSGTTPAAALAPRNDTDFTPTVAHAQLHQARLLENSRNKRLLSDRELDEKAAAEEAKLSAVQSVRVKVRFPDNTSSEWDVGPSHTGAFLYAAVRHVMARSDEPFHLVLPGGKPIIKDIDSAANTLVRGYKMSGRVLVNLVWEDGASAEARKQPFLQSTVASQGQAVKVPEVPTVADEEPEVAPVKSSAQDEGKKKSSGDGKKMPKWLKLGKK